MKATIILLVGIPILILLYTGVTIIVKKWLKNKQ
jgi:hypothetical protein